jgi:hypothetical protein
MDLYFPSKLTISQKGTYYMAIKFYNSLPVQMKEKAHDVKQFEKDLKYFLYLNSFYALQEYFDRDK